MPTMDEALVAAAENSPAGWAVIAISLVVVAFIVAKYIIPPITQSRERVHMREIDVREKEAANDAARIEANRALAEQTRGMKERVDVLATATAAQTARLTESAARSQEMGHDVAHIRNTTDSTHDIVMDLKHHIIGGEGTD